MKVNIAELYEPPIRANYTITKPIEDFVRGIDGAAPTSLDRVSIPDYQRGRVWSQAQQIAYVEAKLSERLPWELDVIRLNCPNWMGTRRGKVVGLDPVRLEIVDGLQRATALAAFMADELPVFGGHRASGLTGFRMRCSVGVSVNNLCTRAEVLRWYLQINAGGTPHSNAELSRVRALLEQETA